MPNKQTNKDWRETIEKPPVKKDRLDKGVYIVIKDKHGETLRGATITLRQLAKEVDEAIEKGNYVQVHKL